MGKDLFGSTTTHKSKKDNRITTSFPDDIYNFIYDIAEEKDLSFSEVVLRLVEPTVEQIQKQEDLIRDNPKIVAFDLVTS